MTRISDVVRRGFALIAAMLLAGAVMAMPAMAGRPNCLVANLETGNSHQTLQAAVDAASPGDSLQVKGTCAGNTTITKDLNISGKSNPAFGPATLDGLEAGRVVTIRGSVAVTISELRIAHGAADFGAGVATEVDFSRPGTNVVTIVESVISGNTASTYGGGIANDHGIVTLVDSSVRGNTAVTGAGIHNSRDDGTLTLRGKSSVSGNHATGDAGGIYSDTHGNVTLMDRSSVHHNTAGENGGGIVVGDSVVVLNDQSSVRQNTAGGDGGGVYIVAMFGVFEMNDSSSVSGNSPNNVCQAPWPGSLGCIF